MKTDEQTIQELCARLRPLLRVELEEVCPDYSSAYDITEYLLNELEDEVERYWAARQPTDLHTMQEEI
jgi:hypothetical protein